MVDSSQPNNYLQLYVVKSRQGPKTFADGKIKALLEIYPETGLIKSKEDYLSQEHAGEVLKKVNDSFDISLDDIGENNILDGEELSLDDIL